MPSVRQTNFSGGELAPALYGRSDLPVYSRGLRRCRNFIPTSAGRAVSRPGTLYVRAVKDAAVRARLVPFVYSDEDSIVLEFGVAYVRFHHRESADQFGDAPAWSATAYYGYDRVVTYGGLVYRSINVSRNAQPDLTVGVSWEVVAAGAFECTTPYTEDDLPHLKYAQVGDVLWLTHENHPPYRLFRYGEADWVFEEVSFDLYGPALYASAYFPRLTSPDPVPAPGTNPEWIWKWSVVGQDWLNGAIIETSATQVTDGPSPSFATAKNAIDVSSSQHVVLEAKDFSPDPPDTVPPWWGAWEPRTVVWYRGRGAVFGKVGECEVGNFGLDGAFNWTRFVDIGEEPDYTIQPRGERNPFEVFDDASALLRTEDPHALTFFEGRLVFGGTTERPQWLWASWTDDYLRFDLQVPATADTCVEFELAAFRREEIRSMLGLDRCFVLTSGGVWTIAGNGGPLTYSSIQALKHTSEGASWVSPLVAGDTLLYVRHQGGGVNQVAFAEGRQKCDVVDLSALAKHLVDAGDIEEWAYAHDPFKVIWAVRDDGLLLSLTYDRAAECVAWAWHDTHGWDDDEASFESVVTVPGQDAEDEVWTIVRRTVDGSEVRYIERFASRMVTAAEDAVCSDSAVTYDGAATTTITGLDHLEGETVAILADGEVVAQQVVTGGEVELETEAELVHVGLPYTPQLELLDLAADRGEVHTKQKRVTKVSFDVESSRGLETGENFDELYPWQQRSVADSYETLGLHTGQAPVAIRSGWNTHGRAVLQQEDPLPVTVLGVTREVVLGETKS